MYVAGTRGLILVHTMRLCMSFNTSNHHSVPSVFYVSGEFGLFRKFQVSCRFEGARAAYSIIARGPEQIMSQFSVSYGMVLNLLSTRSLQACEHFLARSFLRFQTAGNVEETVAEAQRLESEAERLLRLVEGGGDEELFRKFEAASVCSHFAMLSVSIVLLSARSL